MSLPNNYIGTLFNRVKSRFKNRPDSEHLQVIVRIAITSLFISYLSWQIFHGKSTTENIFYVWLFLVGELVVSVGLLVAIAYNPARSDTRRVIGMLSDYIAMAGVMHYLGELGSPLYGAYLWVTIGNGLRYGPKYLYAAIVLACSTFAVMMYNTPYWSSSPYLSWSLLLALLAVPLYFASLLKALTNAITEAQRANEAKTRFLANMSHEFRTPLNGLGGAAELLSVSNLDDEQKLYVKTIQASVSTLHTLVKDVLDISVIESGKIKLENIAFSLSELLSNINFILEPQAKEKGLGYSIHIVNHFPDEILGDKDHLAQILINLINNAIKFTEHGSVSVEVESLPSPVNSRLLLKFSIIDTGIGIPDAYKSKLYEAFQQIDSSKSRRHDGTGLGTTIAKGLVEAMGGAINFESEEGRGTKFWFELPFVLASSHTSVQGMDTLQSIDNETISMFNTQQFGEAVKQNVINFPDYFARHKAKTSSMRILIADDYEANRIVLDGILTRAGHNVFHASSGEEALDILADESFDALIVDLHMPDVSGIDVLKNIRVMEAGKTRTPVFILSADVTPHSIKEAEEAGARAFLAKPVISSKLLSVLDEIANASEGTLKKNKLLSNESLPSDTDEIFNSDILQELSGIDPNNNFHTDFVNQCLEDASACMAKINQCSRHKNWSAIRDHAHALKGISGNLGFIKVSRICENIMNMPTDLLEKDFSAYSKELEDNLSMARYALIHYQDNTMQH